MLKIRGKIGIMRSRDKKEKRKRRNFHSTTTEDGAPQNQEPNWQISSFYQLNVVKNDPVTDTFFILGLTNKKTCYIIVTVEAISASQ